VICSLLWLSGVPLKSKTAFDSFFYADMTLTFVSTGNVKRQRVHRRQY